MTRKGENFPFFVFFHVEIRITQGEEDGHKQRNCRIKGTKVR